MPACEDCGDDQPRRRWCYHCGMYACNWCWGHGVHACEPGHSPKECRNLAAWRRMQREGRSCAKKYQRLIRTRSKEVNDWNNHGLPKIEKGV